MKNFSFSIFNIVAVFSIILLIVLILVPFNLINLEQAGRIAQWKSVYENLKYSFELVNLHEGSIIPASEEVGKIVDEDYIWQRISPYFNLENTKPEQIKRYRYRKMNGTLVKKERSYYFDKFVKTKDGILFSVKKNTYENDTMPLYIAFVDINGIEKPNRMGQDIFFMGIYKNHVSALGQGKTHARLKADCSPIGRGVYCSEYYLLGGSF